MEGLIPFLFKVMKKQSPQNAYRCLSESSNGRSYHLLRAGDSVEDSSHRRTRSDFPQSSTIDSLSGSNHFTCRKSFGARGLISSPSHADNGAMRQRNANSAGNYQASAWTTNYGRYSKNISSPNHMLLN